MTSLLVTQLSDLCLLQVDANRRSALMLAVCNNHLEVVKWLVSRNADVTLRDKMGGSAMHDALVNGHDEVIAYLKTQGAGMWVWTPGLRVNT